MTANIKVASSMASKITDSLTSVKVVADAPMYEQVPDVVRSPADATIAKRGGGTPPLGDVSQLMAELGAAKKIVFKAEKILKHIKQLTWISLGCGSPLQPS